MKELQLLKRPGCAKQASIINTVAPEWILIGDHLDFDDDGSQLKIIKATYPHDGPVTWCREMFQFWLQGNGKVERTWEGLIGVLEDAHYGELAALVKRLIYPPPL